MCTVNSKKRYSDLPERPTPRPRQHDPTIVKIEKIPEKQKKKRTTIQIPSFYAVKEPSSLLKKRLKSFIQNTLVKKNIDAESQDILKACTDHINAYSKTPFSL